MFSGKRDIDLLISYYILHGKILTLLRTFSDSVDIRKDERKTLQSFIFSHRDGLKY